MTEKDLEDQKAHAEATSDLIVENEKLKAELKALRAQLVCAWEALSEIAGSQGTVWSG